MADGRECRRVAGPMGVMSTQVRSCAVRAFKRVAGVCEGLTHSVEVVADSHSVSSVREPLFSSCAGQTLKTDTTSKRLVPPRPPATHGRQRRPQRLPHGPSPDRWRQRLPLRRVGPVPTPATHAAVSPIDTIGLLAQLVGDTLQERRVVALETGILGLEALDFLDE